MQLTCEHMQSLPMLCTGFGEFGKKAIYSCFLLLCDSMGEVFVNLSGPAMEDHALIDLKSSLDSLVANSDTFFLLVMACLIFCKFELYFSSQKVFSF